MTSMMVEMQRKVARKQAKVKFLSHFEENNRLVTTSFSTLSQGSYDP